MQFRTFCSDRHFRCLSCRRCISEFPFYYRNPRWKLLARPGLTQRKSTQPAAWEHKQSRNHGAGTMQVHPHATDTARPGVARTPQAQEGAVAAKKGQGRQVGGQEAKKRGPKTQRSPKGEDWLWTHSPITLTPPPTETPTRCQTAQAECPNLQGRRATLPRQIFYP